MRRTISALFTALLIAAPSLVFAQSPQTLKVWDGTQWRTVTGNSTGAMNTTESNPITEFIRQQQGWKVGALVCGNRDSTLAAVVRGAGRINLYLYGNTDSLTRAGLVGVTIYAHFASGNLDTLTRALWLRRPTSTTADLAAARLDTIGAFLGAFARTNTIADSTLAYGEIPWVIESTSGSATTAKNRQYPPILMLPLVDRNGAPLIAERISIGLRFYKAYDGTNYSPATATTRTVRYIVALEALR